MKELELSVQDIKELIDGFCRGGLGSMKLQAGGVTLELESGHVGQAARATAVPAAAPAVDDGKPASDGELVTSPIVGTFYEAPAPDKDPFVTVGSRVHKGDVLFIIESMKLMNEVTSDLDGVVREILVENAQGVEYGQPVLVIAQG